MVNSCLRDSLVLLIAYFDRAGVLGLNLRLFESTSSSSLGPGAYALEHMLRMHKAYCETLIPPCDLDVPTFAARRLHVHTTREILAVKVGTCGRECWPVILPKCRLYTLLLGIVYMPQVCDMEPTKFTSPPKEGVLRIFFSPRKILTASAGFEPANLGT